MQILRSFRFVIAIILFSSVFTPAQSKPKDKTNPLLTKISTRQLVEGVDIQGNRRLKDQDLLYYIKTRKGDTYSAKQVQSDLKELLSFNWFDKTVSRAITEPGIRGGVRVIFEVKELPIIRDLAFKGAKAIQESDILKAFREGRVGISKEAIYDPVNSRKAKRVLREMLASKGYPNSKVEVKEEEVSATSVAVTFEIDQGHRSRIVKIEFEGNKVFKDGELRKQLQLVKAAGLISRFKSQDVLDLRKLEYDLQKNVREYMFSKGYFQARIGEPKVVGLGYERTGIPVLGVLPLPLISSKDDTLKLVIPVIEGRIFRVGKIEIEGNSIFSKEQVSAIIGVKKGEIANGKRLRSALFENLKKIYGSQGFVEYDAELTPEFKDNPNNAEEGIVDIAVKINEGKQYRLRRLEFVGNTFTRDKVLRREILINEGDIYDQSRLDISVARLNQLGYFDRIDKEKDLEVRTDSDQGFVDSIVKVSERGKQQISFNGGVSGIDGSFFGLEYSTNNLFGRGNSVSFAFSAGNSQQSFQVSYQEPYFFDRPISVGFSLFASKSKFFGDGTLLSENVDAILGALDTTGTFVTDEDNLFTRTTYGGTFFATAKLSEFLFKKRRFTQFSRVGLTYQFSATSIEDPPVNQSADVSQQIPIIYAQPNIITSRITPTFVYDTRQPARNGIDTLKGTQISASFALAGLGGDVRTYKPSISFSKFIPIRRRKAENPEVFAFRIQASTTGSFSISDKIRNANSIAFVGGVPIFEREFLGSEFDIRGYDTRSIGPIAPYNTFIATQNVQIASNLVGMPELTRVVGVDADGQNITEPLILPEVAANQINQLANYTGIDGANPLLFQGSYQPIGGDTKILGNFEYRIPLFGPATLAAFADIGTVFNLRDTGIQTITSSFLRDDQLVGAGTLTLTSLLQNEQFERSFGSFLFDGNQILSATQFESAYCGGVRADCPLTIPDGLTPLFLRSDVQTIGQVDVDNSAFNSFSDFRSSVGLELRVQVPVVNVPFRLIYYYNPNAQLGYTEELPGLFLSGKRSGFRFSVGRTF